MKRPAITSFIAALSLGTVALVALAQIRRGRPDYWPTDQTGHADARPSGFRTFPGTRSSARTRATRSSSRSSFPTRCCAQAEIEYCNAPGGNPALKLSQEDCMIEVGVANILGYHRIDTLYDPTDSRISKECTTQACTEVRLEVSNFIARSTGSGVALKPEVIGSVQKRRCTAASISPTAAPTRRRCSGRCPITATRCSLLATCRTPSATATISRR